MIVTIISETDTDRIIIIWGSKILKLFIYLSNGAVVAVDSFMTTLWKFYVLRIFFLHNISIVLSLWGHKCLMTPLIIRSKDKHYTMRQDTVTISSRLIKTNSVQKPLLAWTSCIYFESQRLRCPRSLQNLTGGRSITLLMVRLS